MSANTAVMGQEACRFDYELVPTPCCFVKPSGIITECNTALARLVGLSDRSAIVGKSILDLIDAKSQPDFNKIFLPKAEDVTKDAFKPKAVWIHSRKTNDSFPCSIQFKSFADASGRVIGLNIAIIDERRYAVQIDQMQREQDRMIRNEKLKQEFIAVASHELRTPIQPILGFALLAKKGMISQEKAWDAVLQEARRLQQLATDILDASRIEAGSLKYEFKKERIIELLGSLVESYKLDLNKTLELRVEHQGTDVDFEIEIDRSRITQVFSNLLSNAIKFTENGSVSIETKAYPERNEFEIRVNDSGVGLSKEVLPLLFEKFGTMGHANVQNKKGTGLGLYITKSIIESHKGSISAINNSAGGATFIVILPISQNR